MILRSDIFARIRQYDWWLLIAVLLLSALGFAAIYSLDLAYGGEQLVYFPTQVIAFGLGLAMLVAAATLHVSWYQATARGLFFLSTALLIGVLFFGRTIRGTQGWFRLYGWSFQPAELAKIALIVSLSIMVERHARARGRPYFFVSSLLSTALLSGLILLQPDLGSALVLLALWFSYLLLSHVRRRYVLLVVGGAVAAGLIAWFWLFQPYQRERIFTFLAPERDPLGSGYNVTQSIIAIGAGQWSGRGLSRGSQSQLHFLPEAQTDFIFAVIAEELGFVGVTVLLALYTLLLYRLLTIARRASSDFAAALVIGIALLFFWQLFLNVGGAVGLIPITGVTLPFLSYGGSSLVINLILIGMAESVASGGTLRSDSQLLG